MPSSQNLEIKQYSLRLNPCPLILAVIVFVWSFNASVAPFTGLVLGISSLVIGILSAYIYRSDIFVLALSRKDFLVAAGFFVFLIASHCIGLFVPLGGDELYHAGRSALFLHALKSKIDLWAPLDITALRSSIWSILDFRHLAVVDIWRLQSLLIIFGISALSVWLFAHQRQRKVKVFIVFLGIAVILGQFVKLAPENHPPLRLFPLLVGQLLFGLNHFAYRIPAVFTAALVIWSIYLTIDYLADKQPFWWKVLSSISAAFIPVVFYISEAVEPSIYAYFAYILMIIIILLFIKTSDSRFIVWGGVVAGLAVLFRQSTIVLWLPVVVMFLVSSNRTNILFALRVFLPGLLDIPYLYTAKSLGHAAIAEDLPIIHKLIDSLTGGVGIMSVLNTTTLPWVVAVIFSFIFLLLKGPKKNWLVFLMVIPSYCMFYVIWTYLWGVGRYQAEYVAPFIATIFMLQAISATAAIRRIYSLVFPVLFISTLELNSNLSLDINYSQWPKMRISTTATFPYKEAFQYIKREEAAANSILLGGSPWYGEFVSWLYGYSFTEASKWQTIEDQALAHVNAGTNQNNFAKFCREKEIKFILIQSGTRRERQHRTEAMAALIDQLETTNLEQRSLFYKVATFNSAHGGIINIYTLKK